MVSFIAAGQVGAGAVTVRYGDWATGMVEIGIGVGLAVLGAMLLRRGMRRFLRELAEYGWPGPVVEVTVVVDETPAA